MPAMSLFTAPHRVLVLGYGSLLATVAGFVNAVAILTLAIPVGNVTATTTQLGMDAANPWMFETSLLVAIIVGFCSARQRLTRSWRPRKPMPEPGTAPS